MSRSFRFERHRARALSLATALAPAMAPALAILLAGCVSGARPAGAGAAGVLQTAQAVAVRSPDPVAAKLAIWLRAQIPGAASASEIDSFLRDNPDWPSRPLLAQRLQQALAVEPDDAIARTLCAAYRPDTAASLLRCATALSDQGVLPPAGNAPGQALSLAPAALPATITAAAAAAWVGGNFDETGEAEFVRLFGQIPTPSEQWQRFDRLEWSGAIAAARRQIPRLSSADMPLATTRLALRSGESGADGLAAALHGSATDDPALLLDLARWERKHDRIDEDFALWHGRALAAERTAAPNRQPAFWTEREALARELLVRHRDADALFLAQDEIQTDPAPRLDSAFLSGWIALRRLNRPADAAAQFARLTQESRSVITTSRGFYWLGRALDAQGQSAAAHDAYIRAARRPTSFYGQASIRVLSPGDEKIVAAPIEQIRDPGWTQAEAIRFAGVELARAATMLVAWGDAHHAGLFLLRLDERASSDADHALGASFADRLGLPDVAVAIARAAGRHGLVLAQAGWPAPFTPPAAPALPPGLAMAIIRQESSFDPAIVSPAGARGLMQLMPATARTLSGSPVEASQLSQPGLNMALGTSYLASLLGRFGGQEPYAVAAYNAGPSRVAQWLQQNGDPSLAPGATHLTGAQNEAPDEEMIDWIELIPFSETRNYVQRVLESQTIYRVRGGAQS